MQIVPFQTVHTTSITTLYAHYVTQTAITFDLTPPTPEQLGEKLSGLQQANYPVLVALDQNQTLLGFAYASAYRPKAAYQHTAEITIYVQPDAHGQGIGSALMQSLIDDLKQKKQFHLAIAMIADDAKASIKLHKKFGFQEVGYLEEVGYKFDKWHGVNIMQRKLNVAP